MNLLNKIRVKESTIIKMMLMISIVFLSISCSTSEEQTVTTYENLVLTDDFDEDGVPNPEIWTYDIGTGSNGWGNNELQYYRSENAVVENGVLKITAKQEDFDGSSYTSARIKTQGLFTQKYGRFEARIKLPWGQGMWPAFWLLGENIETVGWPTCGEIDIMEYRGQEPTIMHGTIHGPGYSGVNGIGKSYDLMTDRFDTDFHIFGIEWSEDYINFYVDDVLYNQIKPEDLTGEWVYNQPFFIIINLAVGGNYVGAPNDQTTFPQTMEIDYVRVYNN